MLATQMSARFQTLLVLAPFLAQLVMPGVARMGRWVWIESPTHTRCMLTQADRDRDDVIIADDLAALSVQGTSDADDNDAVSGVAESFSYHVIALLHSDQRAGDLAARAPPFRPPTV